MALVSETGPSELLGHLLLMPPPIAVARPPHPRLLSRGLLPKYSISLLSLIQRVHCHPSLTTEHRDPTSHVARGTAFKLPSSEVTRREDHPPSLLAAHIPPPQALTSDTPRPCTFAHAFSVAQKETENWRNSEQTEFTPNTWSR